LLDEPINHLDIPSRARFEEALANFKGTILAVVHDRYFIERFASDVWRFRMEEAAMTWSAQAAVPGGRIQKCTQKKTIQHNTLMSTKS
jgi:ATPase subunit of ABC transporter with duplicated ATPase domains